jgi:four helix bundle protein
MNPTELKERTQRPGRRSIRWCDSLFGTEAARILSRQHVRAGTSAGANCRVACRARSRADCIANLATVEAACDECLYWSQQAVEAGWVKPARVADWMKEGTELLALVAPSIHTARRRGQSAVRTPPSPLPTPHCP